MDSTDNWPTRRFTDSVFSLTSNSPTRPLTDRTSHWQKLKKLTDTHWQVTMSGKWMKEKHFITNTMSVYSSKEDTKIWKIVMSTYSIMSLLTLQPHITSVLIDIFDFLYSLRVYSLHLSILFVYIYTFISIENQFVFSMLRFMDRASRHFWPKLNKSEENVLYMKFDQLWWFI